MPESSIAQARTVFGVCPMGCGSTLFLGDGGYITCSYAQCPNPTAAAEILSQEASAQRTAEALASTTDRFKLEAELEAMKNLVGALLVELKGAWWLKAAIAYQGLDRMLRSTEEVNSED